MGHHLFHSKMDDKKHPGHACGAGIGRHGAREFERGQGELVRRARGRPQQEEGHRPCFGGGSQSDEGFEDVQGLWEE